MGMSGGNNGQAMAEINVTPLVDVMLVLLIIFMVTAPMMNEEVGIEVPTTDAPPLDREDTEQLVLRIGADQTLYIGDQELTPDEFPVRLAALAKVNPELDVFLEADGSVPYREVAAMLGVAKQAGWPKVGLVFDLGSPKLGADEGSPEP